MIIIYWCYCKIKGQDGLQVEHWKEHHLNRDSAYQAADAHDKSCEVNPHTTGVREDKIEEPPLPNETAESESTTESE